MGLDASIDEALSETTSRSLGEWRKWHALNRWMSHQWPGPKGTFNNVRLYLTSEMLDGLEADLHKRDSDIFSDTFWDLKHPDEEPHPDYCSRIEDCCKFSDYEELLDVIEEARSIIARGGKVFYEPCE